MSNSRDTESSFDAALRELLDHFEGALARDSTAVASPPSPEESDERFSFILEQIRAEIIDVGSDGRISYVSPTSTQIHGYTPEEMVGRQWAERLHPDDVDAVRGLVRAISVPETPARAVFRMQHRDGHWIWIEATVVMIYRSADGVIHGATFMREVTGDKHAADALAESEERYRVISRASRDLITEMDADGVPIYVSDTIRECLGYEPEELIGGDSFPLLHPEDLNRISEVFAKGMTSGIPQNTGPYRAYHKDGTIRWLEGTGVSYVRAEGQTGYLTVTRDISERVQAERERRELEERMQQAQKLEGLGVMAGGIAHDFNNLLTPILGEAGLSLMELPQDSPARAQIQKIQKAAHRAASLTNQMLAYAGEGPLLIEPVQISKLAAEMARLIEGGVPSSTKILYDLDKSVPLVNADASQLSQVAMNLVTNATEAVGDADGMVAIRTGTVRPGRDELAGMIFGELRATGLYVYLEVSDNGCGMDVDTRRRIFDPFFTTKFTGRGLGLAAVLGIVRSHGGAIEIASQLDRGTRFRVLFPSSGVEEAVAATTDESVPIESWRSRGRVLIVDDDAAVRDFAEDTLARAGFEVLTAGDGREGIETFRKFAERIRVVILDRTMPAIGGEEAFQAIRQIRPDARVILVSGYLEDRAVGPLRASLTGFLKKPFLPTALLRAVRAALDEQ